MGTGIIFGIILLLIAIYGKREGRFLNPITLMCFLWGAINILSSLCLYTLYEASTYIYYYINGGVISFIIGYYFLKTMTHNKGVRFQIGKRKLKGEYILNKRLCYVGITICLIFILMKLAQYRRILFSKGFSLGAIQAVLLDNSVGYSGWLNAISVLIVNPLMVAIPAAVIVDYFIRKKDKSLLLLAILLCVGKVILSGGRQAFIQIFLYSFIALNFSFDAIKKGLSERIKAFNKRKSFFKVGLLTIVVLGVLTISRTSNVIKTIYLDFAMEPVMLEIWIDRIDASGQRAFGLCSTLGFVYPLFYILKNFLGIPMPIQILNVYNMYISTMSEWVAIGSSLAANAYVTCFWYLYYDFGVLGIIMIMFICGMVSYNIYVHTCRVPNSKNTCTYVFLCMALFYTFGDFYPANMNFVLGYIYTQCFLYKKKKSSRGRL